MFAFLLRLVIAYLVVIFLVRIVRHALAGYAGRQAPPRPRGSSPPPGGDREIVDAEWEEIKDERHEEPPPGPS
jgi:hypothetical protein